MSEEKSNENQTNEIGQEQNLRQQLQMLREALEGFLRAYTNKHNLSFADMVYELNQRYDILEETLATVTNWLALHKSIIRSLSVIDKLTDPKLVAISSEDGLRTTIRTGLLPQTGTMVQNVQAGLKGAERILPLVEKELKNLVSDIRNLKEFDETFLKIIDYNELSDGLLSEILHNIYSGHQEESTKKLFKLLNNVKNLLTEKGHTQPEEESNETTFIESEKESI